MIVKEKTKRMVENFSYNIDDNYRLLYFTDIEKGITYHKDYNKIKEAIRDKILIGRDITLFFTILLRNNVPVFNLIKDYEDTKILEMLGGELDNKRKFLYENIEKQMIKITALMNCKGLGIDIPALTTILPKLNDKELAIGLKIFEYGSSGIIYGFFNPMASLSGRMACDNFNLQQIPKSLRHIFTSKYKNGRLVVVDLPQIELRLAGLLYSKTIRDFLIQGLDLHTETAKLLYGKSNITNEERQIAKAVNFGLLYGMGWQSLKQYIYKKTNINVDDNTIINLRKRWLEVFKDIKHWHRKVAKTIQENGYYEDETILFRKYKTNKFTTALNYKIQGSGADLLKAIVVKFYKKTGNIPSALIHDEFIYDTPNEEEARKLLKEFTITIEEVWKKFFEIAEKYHNIKTDYFPLPIDTEAITPNLF